MGYGQTIIERLKVNFIFLLLRVNLLTLEDHDIHLENKF